MISSIRISLKAAMIAALAFAAVSCGTRNDKTSTGLPFGINLSVAEFGSDFPGIYGKDYIYPTVEDFDYLKDKGFTLARIPFKWERIQDGLGGALREFDLAELKKAVTLAGERGIKVILDLHNYGRYYKDGNHSIIGTDGVGPEHLADLWKKLAHEFRGFDNIYGYALMNEPHDLEGGTPWFRSAQMAIYSIREADPQTTIIVGGDSWSSAERWMSYSDNLKYLFDPSDNLIFEAHIYFDHDNSGTYKYDYDGEQAHRYKGIERIQPFANWLKVNGKRGFIGEYGIPGDDPRWLETLDEFLKYMSANGINGAYWAAGPWWPESDVMSVKPFNGKDRPQMEVLGKYLHTGTE